MSKTLIKKLAEVLSIILLSLLILFWLFAFLTRASVPEWPQVIREDENICVEFKWNLGSGKFYNVYSFHCDKEPNWEEINLTPLFLWTGWVLDLIFTMECPLVDIKKDSAETKIYIKQNRFCKYFVHDYVEKTYILYTNKNWKFISLK